jgi:formylglycine-generating enzyme required for sulfatase activity
VKKTIFILVVGFVLALIWLIQDKNAAGMRFVEIPAGSFTMGCTAEQGPSCKDSARPAHEVRLTQSFWMQTTEVTQRQWREVMGANPSHFSSCGDDCPVENVSWEDADRFAKKLSAEEGLKGSAAYRLPTEAEWEYAARAGESSKYALPWREAWDEKYAVRNGWGTKYAGSDKHWDVAWFEYTSDKKTHPVGKKQANAWGLHDMSGNVYEFTSDRYARYDSAERVDPVGAHDGVDRVIRGGSWQCPAYFILVSARYHIPPDVHSDLIGFRLARTSREP